MIKKILTIAIALVCPTVPLAAMQGSKKTDISATSKSIQVAHTLTSKEEWGHGEYFQSMLLRYMDRIKASGNGKVRFNFNIITNEKIAAKIIELHKELKKATGEDCVFILIDSYKMHISKQKLIKSLVDAGIPVKIFMECDDHWKAVLAEYTDELGEQQKLYIGGSSNASVNALGNPEIDLILSNFATLYRQSVEFFDTLFEADTTVTYQEYLRQKKAISDGNVPTTPPKQIGINRKNPKETPKTPTFLSSTNTDIWGTIIDRFEKMEKGDNAFFGTYTFNHKGLTKALSDYANKGVNVSFYTDKKSLTGPARSQIEDLINAGVNLFVYASANQHLMHAKFAIFDRVNRSEKKEEKKIVISTSQNAVERGPDHKRVEGMVIVPNDPDLLTTYKDILGRFKIISIEEFKKMDKKEINQKLEARPIVQLKNKLDIDRLTNHLKDLNKRKQSAPKRKLEQTEDIVFVNAKKRK